MAFDISRITSPVCLSLRPEPANFVAAIRPTIISPRNAVPIIPLIRFSQDILPKSLHTTAIRSIASPILRIQSPTLEILLPANLVAAIRPAISTAKTDIPITALPKASHDMLPIIFKVKATINKAAAIPFNVLAVSFIFAPFFPITIEDLDIFSVAAAKPNNIAERTATTLTAFHSFSGSKNVNTTIQPTSIATEVANFFIASALRSNATPFITLEKLFTTLAVFFNILAIGLADLSSIFAVLPNIPDTPSNIPAIASDVLPSFFMKIAELTVSIPVITSLNLISFNISMHF